MNKPVETAATCTVAGADRLPPESGGADALCSEIRRIVGSVHAGVEIAVRVKRSGLEADVRLANGRALPVIGLAVSDKRLDHADFVAFAHNIANAIGKQD